MSKFILLMLLLLFTYSMVDGFNGYETRLAEIQEEDPAHGFLQMGYFRDKSERYILAVIVPTSVNKDQVEDYARDRTGKAGEPARLYFFEGGPGVPHPGATTAGHLAAGEKLLYSREAQGKWRFAFLRKPDGTTRTVDCDKYPESDLCSA